MKIGIAYTVHNRNAVARQSIIKCIDNIKTDWHSHIVLVIVDDASMEMFHTADYRFDNNVGVCVSKNKCLELLYNAGCTDFFLIDDDTYPIVKNWTSYYTQSPLNHACYTFNRQLISEGSSYNVYKDPNGCMLYFKRICLDTVGGWDTSFKGYGYEHSNLSDRIFNAGLTPDRYIDIPNSKGLFAMVDCESSFTDTDRSHIRYNYELYKQNFNSKDFIPFK